jgi:hypothetical protein
MSILRNEAKMRSETGPGPWAGRRGKIPVTFSVKRQ